MNRQEFLNKLFAAAAAAFVLVLLSKERKEGDDMIMPSEEGR